MTFCANWQTTNTINAYVYTTQRPGGDFLIKVRGAEIKVLTRAVQQLSMLPGANTKSHFCHPKADTIPHFDSPRVDK